MAELLLVLGGDPLVAPSLELGGIGGVERGGSDGPLPLMLVLGTLLGFQGIPLSAATV